MTDAATTLFDRRITRNRLTARTADVVAVTRPAPRYVRVTLTGPDFADFRSDGPSDHARVFFPDPATGDIVAPHEGPDGHLVHPEGQTFARDFTPLNVRDEGGRRLVDLDILQHDGPGPATNWGARARVGDRLVVAGPRGSHAATQGAPRVLLAVDGTSLPAAGRWLAEVPAATRVDVIVDETGELGWVRAYLHGFAERPVQVTAADGDVKAAVLAAGVDATTYVFAAGEASALVALRRCLRHELNLPREQFTVSGYWRHGVEAWDHHAPLDPADQD